MKTNLELLQGYKTKSAIAAGLIGAIIPLSWLTFIIIIKEDLLEKWMLFPLIIIPSGGIIAGVFFYLMSFVWFPSGKKKLAATIFSTIAYFIVIWLSAVMAFSLTGDWD